MGLLYIQLTDAVSVESEAVAPTIVLDFNEQAQVIEIEDASKYVDLAKLEVAALPFVDLIFRKNVVTLA